MASPAETLPPAPTQQDEFDPLVFWLRHRQQIMLLLVMMLVAGALSLVFWRVTESRRVNSENAFAAASTPEELQKVAADYPSSIAGGNALLMLAEKQRAAGKLEESNATLRSFIEKQPKHPLFAGAYTSLGANLELQGKLDEALAQYKTVVASYPLSFTAPAAYVAEGRILQAQGKVEEAKSSFESVTTQFPESTFREEAMTQLQKLKK